ncbi:MAG: signal peptidase I [Nitrosopumilus sp.]
MEKKFSKRDLLMIALIFLNSAILLMGHCGYSLHRNVGYSLPHLISYGRPIGKIKRGMYVSFSHPLSKQKVTKKVIGIPGDKIDFKEDQLLVNEEKLSVFPESKKLHLIKKKKVCEGYLFVSGSHPKSFDSRYEEFGLVPIHSIERELCPIY